MKHEILFRGKSIGTGEWLYGYLFNYGLTAPTNVPCICVCVPKSWKEAYNLYTVSPESIGQYTGLKDKNGIKIFEGDIIESNGYKHLVKYNENLAGFCAVNVKHPEDLCGINQQWINECSKVVIGNVTDNPEMVKECSNEA
jgi:prophage lp2 protein 26